MAISACPASFNCSGGPMTAGRIKSATLIERRYSLGFRADLGVLLLDEGFQPLERLLPLVGNVL
jgi:hypothetical protein